MFLFLFLFSAHQRGVWENTAYHDDGGLFLHSIAEGFLSRIQIKYPAESHEHDALLPFSQCKSECHPSTSHPVSQWSARQVSHVYSRCVCTKDVRRRTNSDFPTACSTLGDRRHVRRGTRDQRTFCRFVSLVIARKLFCASCSETNNQPINTFLPPTHQAAPRQAITLLPASDRSFLLPNGLLRL